MRLGDIRQYRVVIDNYDVTEGVIGSKIFQSILEPSWTAQIFFDDSADLISTLPIQSGSKVKILMETKHGVSTDMKHEFEFYVYRVGDKQRKNQKEMTYTVYAASKEFIKNLTTRVSRNFKNTKMTDAVREICKDNFPDITIGGSNCENNANLIIPQWTPYNSIGWMMKMAYLGGRADYLFFQDGDKSYMLDSITNLYNKTASSEVLRVRPANLNNEPQDVFNMIKYNFEHADASTNLVTGFYGNTLKTFDFRTKKWNVSEYKSTEEKNWTDMFDNAKESVVTFKAKSKGVNGTANSPSDDAEIWLQSRFASIQMLEQERLLAQTSGSVGTYQWLGKCINVDLPNQSALTQESNSIKYKGRYLVRAIVHSVDRQTYVCNFELVKRNVNKTWNR